ERNKPQFVGSGILGSNNTRGDEAVLSALYGRASVSVGQFHYHTNGFRENNDQKHNVYNAFIQYAFTPRFNVQAEVRTRKTENGDLLLDFDRAIFDPTLRHKFKQDTARVGARFSLSPRQDLIASVMYLDGRAQEQTSSILSFDSPDFSQTYFTRNSDVILKGQGYQAEVQYLFRDNRFNITAGGGTYRIIFNKGSQTNDVFQRLPGGSPCDFDSCTSSDTLGHLISERTNGYVYTNVKLPKNLNLTLGLSYDSYKDTPDSSSVPQSVYESQKLAFDKANPKFGMQWDITSGLRLRLAWFETVKSALIANQTIEPTQIAGFNQLFDDLNGTRTQRMGIGLDTHAAKNIYGGFEVSARDLEVPLVSDDLSLAYTQKQKEKLYRAYFYWLPHPHWAIRGEPQLEKFTRGALSAGPAPSLIETFSTPVSVNYFNPNGIFSKFTATYVRQKLERGTISDNTGDSDFLMLDTSIGYRLPKRRGLLSLEGRNLLDQDFSFRNINFQNAQPFYNQRFSPGRMFFLRLTLNF
ncbi:MAG: TonB-dependent receptor, partial [Nitrosospira sp.]